MAPRTVGTAERDARGQGTRVALLALGGAAVVVALAADRLLDGQPGFGLEQRALLAVGAATSALALAGARTRRAALALLLAGTAALALGELAARAFLAPRFASIYRLDAECLHALAPGARKLFVHRPENGGHAIEVAIDAQGFRGPELAPKGERRRVLVYGDSCVEAEFSRLEDTFVERLGRELGPRAQMVNAGVVGYGPDQALVRMRRELAKLEADLAVFVLFADNDLGDLVRNKLFGVDERGALVAQPFRIGPRLHAQVALARSGLVLERVLRRTLERRRAARRETALADPVEREHARVREWLAQCRAEHEETVVRGDLVVQSVFEDHYDADVALEPGSPSAAYKLALLRAVIEAMQRAADDSGAHLLVVVLPSRVDACAERDLGWIDPAEWPEWRPGALAVAAEDAVRAAGASCASLLETFRAGGGCALYFRGGDSHWNERGQALAARAVAERIAREGWLE